MNKKWFSVTCLFHHPTRKHDDERFLFEERITIWMADSFDEAYLKADAEAREYAEQSESVFVESVSAFRLFDETIAEGTEVQSLMRGSNFDPAVYRDTFCNTERDRAAHIKGS